MSALDQAFIRAYEGDGGTLAPAPGSRPHMGVFPGTGKTQGGTVGATESKSLGADRRLDSGAVGRHPDASSPEDSGGQSARGERRPLSSFSAGPVVEASFEPALEVDQFRFSQVSHELITTHRAAWQGALEAIAAALESGQTVLGVAGADHRVGATTTVICLARMLQAAGIRTVMVDGDFRSAALASHLGLAVELGWEDVLAGRIPLAESVITSLEDGMTLLPLVHGGEPSAEKLDTIHASVTAGVLRYHHDVVLLDLGPLTVASQAGVARRIVRQCRLDGVLLVTDDRVAGEPSLDLLDNLAPELAEIYLGDVANLALPTAA
jgi:Mrp family chromosome partitioning ATPase